MVTGAVGVEDIEGILPGRCKPVHPREGGLRCVQGNAALLGMLPGVVPPG
jgi:hypothetical protein